MVLPTLAALACQHTLSRIQLTVRLAVLYAQHILAMEKRFHTTNFAFRFFTSMLGFVVVNAFFAHRYWNNDKVTVPMLVVVNQDRYCITQTYTATLNR